MKNGCLGFVSHAYSCLMSAEYAQSLSPSKTVERFLICAGLNNILNSILL